MTALGVPPPRTNYWAIASLIFGVFGAFLADDADDIGVTEVTAGTCLDKIDCDRPHPAEVFALLRMPDGDYPGDGEVDAYQQQCGPALTDYSRATAEDADIDVFSCHRPGTPGSPASAL